MNINLIYSCVMPLYEADDFYITLQRLNNIAEEYPKNLKLRVIAGGDIDVCAGRERSLSEEAYRHQQELERIQGSIDFHKRCVNELDKKL